MVKKNHSIVEVDCIIKHETDKAYLVESLITNKTAWVPKSFGEVEHVDEESGRASVQMPEWMAEEKELI